MLPNCFRPSSLVLAYEIVLVSFLLDWTSGAVLPYQQKDGRLLGEMEPETDARFGRHASPDTSQSSTDKKTYCGQRLVQHMKDICWGRHNGSPAMYGHRKRYADYTGMFGDSDKNERIVEECCKQPCEFAQLRKYCGQYVPSILSLVRQAEAKAGGPEQAQEDTLTPLTPSPPPPSPPAKGDEGLSPNPFMLQLQDWYGAPRSSPPRHKYINYVPDYSTPTLSRRPIFSSNQRRVNRLLIKQQGKPLTNHTVRKFQQPSLVSDETERDYISQEEALSLRPTSSLQHRPFVSPYRNGASPVTLPIGVTDQLQSYYS